LVTRGPHTCRWRPLGRGGETRDMTAWPRHNPETRPTMDFDTPIRVIDNPDATVSDTWEGVWAAPS